jgi:ATP-binding cassette, subfamily B, bacterial PglK
LIENLKKIYSHLSGKRRKQFAILLLVMFMSSISEIISLGAVIPFLSVLMSPDFIFEHKNAKFFIEIFNINSPDQLLLPITLIFIIAAFIAGFMRLFFLWASVKLAYFTGADFTVKVYKLTLYQPYSVHVSRNSSEVINVMVSKVNSTIQSTLMPTLTLISSSILLLFAISFLFILEPLVTIVTFLVFGIIYLIISIFSKKKLLTNGKRIALEHNKVVKLLQEGLGGIRDVIIDGNQELYANYYKKSDGPLRNAQAINLIIASSPKFIIESLGICLLASAAYFFAKDSQGIIEYIPIIGVLALSAQRLLPEIQKLFNSWASMNSAKASVIDTLNFLNQPVPEYLKNNTFISNLSFKREISFKNLSFRYHKDEPWVLKKINLSITKGSRVGFIGSTGGGKSTLIDIILCLLNPTEGSLVIDNTVINSLNFRNWQNQIAHVPQNIFLTDGTIIDNIAFGIQKEKVDIKLVKECAIKAQLSDSIESWSKKYHTIIGERGVRLSGGQRQRIGIARALYKRAKVFIFDEATNALDSKTENEVINSIYKLDSDLTIIMIAHRLSTLKGCSKIIKLDNGLISKIGNYQEIVENV